MEACAAVQKKHATMAVMLLTADAEKGKALAYAVSLPDRGIPSQPGCLQINNPRLQRCLSCRAWTLLAWSLACCLQCPVLINADADVCCVCLQGVPQDLTSKLKAGDWLQSALAVLGGKGGGKPTAAQGQGPEFQKVDEAMEAAKAKAAASF